jgi:stage II sporulation protein R
VDQELKLYIRDCLLDKVRDEDIYNKEYIYENADEITRFCNTLIKEKGFNYQARVMKGKYYFPTKTYQNISLPAGEYEAIRIVLGEGCGENWWCVMYPPLCFTNESRGTLSEKELSALADGMSKEGFDIINNNEDKITIKPAFKLVELWQEAKHKIIK